MEPLLIIAGGGGLIAAAVAILIWRLVRNYGKKEVLERDNEAKKATLDSVLEAKKSRMRLESDDSYANRVRSKYTRD